VTSDGLLKTCLHLDRGQPLPLGDEEALRLFVLEAVKGKPASHLFGKLGEGCQAEDRSMSRLGG
jgi:molybdenum cofactor biosynthesis enzyme MoaA